MANPGPASVGTFNTALLDGNLGLLEVLSVTISPAILVPAATGASITEQSYGLNGSSNATAATSILAGDVILGINKPTTQSNIGIVGFRNSATTNDLFYVSWLNCTTITQTPTASEVYKIMVGRPIGPVTGSVV